MTQPPSRAHDLASRLLRSEGVSDASDSEAIVAAADHVLRRLQTDLTRWFGSEGFQALLLRALDRARPGHPALAQVILRFDDGSPGQHGLDGLFNNVRPCSPKETRDAFVAVIASVIALLGRLVGDDVAIRLVTQGWPELLRGEPRSIDEGTRE